MVPRRAGPSPEPPAASPASFLNEESKAPEARVSTSTRPGKGRLGASWAGLCRTLEAGGPAAPFRKRHSWFGKSLQLHRSRAHVACVPREAACCPGRSRGCEESCGAGPRLGKGNRLRGQPTLKHHTHLLQASMTSTVNGSRGCSANAERGLRSQEAVRCFSDVRLLSVQSSQGRHMEASQGQPAAESRVAGLPRAQRAPQNEELGCRTAFLCIRDFEVQVPGFLSPD